MTPAELEARVLGVVAEALDHPRETISLDASLIDDLGAESIDLLDIVFRLETEFDLKISETEIWGELTDGTEDPAALSARLAELKLKRPGFRWDRIPEAPRRHDLPRLLTPRTIVDYLENRLTGEAARSA